MGSFLGACGFLSGRGAQALECAVSVVVARGLSSCACRLSGPVACAILVHPPGMKPATPALEGGFSITGREVPLESFFPL